MEKFSLFFERNRNPLRKKELADKEHPNNKDWVEQESQKIPDQATKDISKMERGGIITPNEAERLKVLKQAEHRKNLENQFFRTKFPKNAKEIKYDKKEELFLLKGVRVYLDEFALQHIEDGGDKLGRVKMVFYRSLMKLLLTYKDILPNRKPRIIITHSKTNPNFATMTNLGQADVHAAGYYIDRLIYIDILRVGEYKILVHEYAHYLADRIPKQSEPHLRKEYQKMLNSFFKEKTGKRTGRKKLEGEANAENRIQMARWMGLSDELEYASTDFHEWFAVLMENWKHIPINKHTYQLKNLLKKVLTRI